MNTWIGIGRLTKDVELKITNGANPISIAAFTLATDRTYKKEGQPKADFHKIKCFGRLAENCANYIGKGRLVCVTGEVHNNTYEKDGQKYYYTEVIADNVQFLDKPKDSGGSDLLGQEIILEGDELPM